MLSKKSIKILSIVLIAIMLFFMMGSTVFAGISENLTPDENVFSNNGNVATLAKKILGALMWIGIAISIGMLMFLGIKYVTSSPDGKADIKGKLGVYILGFVLIVAATAIVGMLETFADLGANNNSNSGSGSATQQNP